jgi:hypothetical protein
VFLEANGSWVACKAGSPTVEAGGTTVSEVKAELRELAREQLAEAQAEFDLLMEPDEVVPLGDQPVPQGYILGPDGWRKP